jgi:hypothetical protein
MEFSFNEICAGFAATTPRERRDVVDHDYIGVTVRLALMMVVMAMVVVATCLGIFLVGFEAIGLRLDKRDQVRCIMF